MKRVGVLTSGGDAPGMNSAIRAVTRTLIYHGYDVVGIKRGYEGLLQKDFIPMSRSSVGGILLRGGTELRTARCPEFKHEEGINAAVKILRDREIDGLVVIGGDGSFRGAHALHTHGINTIGVPATIDNDISGTDYTIGFDTACNTALNCISKLRDTASSHDRMFIVEVMGRKSGYLALETAVACGAEYVLLPEVETNLEDLCKKINVSKLKGKTHSIVVLAEGVMPAYELAAKIQDKCAYTPRYVVLGHLQRGGVPSCFDSLLGARLGAAAAEKLILGYSGKMVGIINNQIETLPLEFAWSNSKTIDSDKIALIDMLSI